MIYQVMLSENQSVLIHDVDIVQYDEDTVLFREEKGNFIAAFKMYNIMGFFRMDLPAVEGIGIAEPPQWDFEQLAKYSADYQEKERIKIREAEEKKSKGWTDTYAAVMKEAEYIYNHREVHYKEIHDVSNEVMEEAIKRGGMIVTGGVIPLLARNMLYNLMKDETDHYEIDHLNKLLKRNMDDCLGVTT